VHDLLPIALFVIVLTLVRVFLAFGQVSH
jgi:hypothetical protein